MAVEIPDKLYFKIGEVASLTGLKPHVLRYWESEFKSIRPTKSRTQQRLYRKQDIETILQLKDLLYNQGYTIAGARRMLRQKPAKAEVTHEPARSAARAKTETDQMALPLGDQADMQLLAEIHEDLLKLRRLLEQ